MGGPDRFGRQPFCQESSAGLSALSPLRPRCAGKSPVLTFSSPKGFKPTCIHHKVQKLLFALFT